MFIPTSGQFRRMKSNSHPRLWTRLLLLIALMLVLHSLDACSAHTGIFEIQSALASGLHHETKCAPSLDAPHAFDSHSSHSTSDACPNTSEIAIASETDPIFEVPLITFDSSTVWPQNFYSLTLPVRDIPHPHQSEVSIPPFSLSRYTLPERSPPAFS